MINDVAVREVDAGAGLDGQDMRYEHLTLLVDRRRWHLARRFESVVTVFQVDDGAKRTFPSWRIGRWSVGIEIVAVLGSANEAAELDSAAEARRPHTLGAARSRCRGGDESGEGARNAPQLETQ